LATSLPVIPETVVNRFSREPAFRDRKEVCEAIQKQAR
jgi:hypothetical protein